jgi:hypothetical protein
MTLIPKQSRFQKINGNFTRCHPIYKLHAAQRAPERPPVSLNMFAGGLCVFVIVDVEDTSFPVDLQNTIGVHVQQSLGSRHLSWTHQLERRPVFSNLAGYRRVTQASLWR